MSLNFNDVNLDIFLYICREMFSLPNKTGFELVIHFLFSCLDPARCHDHFRSVSCVIFVSELTSRVTVKEQSMVIAKVLR